MKRLLTLCYLIGLNIILYSQIKFERGYFIDNNDNKIKCFIKNEDWKNNPKEFKYKFDSMGVKLTKNIIDVKEFGMENNFTYLKAKIKIDISEDDINKLSSIKEPNWIDDTIFLNILIEGEANLYYYEHKDLKRFFYNIENKEIKQLVYKKYIIQNNIFRENKYYLNQLNNDVNCPNLVISENIKYNRKDLVNYFLEYNSCKREMVRNYDKKNEHKYHLRLTVGLNFTKLKIWNSLSNAAQYDFNSKLSYTIGMEIEDVLPFNKSKWGMILEPSYNYYKSNVKNKYSVSGKVDYKSIDLSSGIRYYIFLD